MKVILTQEVLGLGDPGEIVEVKPGYARNYLIPKGIALEATPQNLRRIEAERKRLEAAQAKEAERIRAEAEKIDGLSLTITARAGEGGKLYGSVTNKDIAQALAEAGFEIDRRRILLEQPIKRTGSFPVKIKLHPQVFVEITVEVKPLEEKQPETPEQPEAQASEQEQPQAEATEAGEGEN